MKFRIKDNGTFPRLGNYIVPKNKLKVAVDLGSNIGLFTTHFRNRFENIYFFEASHKNFLRSCANILSKSIRNSFGFNLAVSSESGKVIKIYSHENGDCGSNTVVANSDGCNTDDYHNVMTISYDDIFKLIDEPRIDYLKIDIEGAEYDLLKDSDLSKVDIIAIELHNLLGEEKMNFLRNKIEETHDCIHRKAAIPTICNEEATYVLKGSSFDF